MQVDGKGHGGCLCVSVPQAHERIRGSRECLEPRHAMPAAECMGSMYQACTGRRRVQQVERTHMYAGVAAGAGPAWVSAHTHLCHARTPQGCAHKHHAGLQALRRPSSDCL